MEQSEEKEEQVDDGEETDEEEKRRGGSAHEGVVCSLSSFSFSLSCLILAVARALCVKICCSFRD